ncbi:hypothetical protein AYI68_g1208 [Smittium mucronatum]|uniref:LITAF domain-containing protein n=1 Tax=Smittium mucronatum TaxID=133383 RepID=A0A1R0H659_9FUNG|nr:hypothetical protein AYI68_g3484 [Smittium mucronatum]OLY84629.1 hypothetical protein AYI68_g1208 [Smittium mucronatum]
MNDKEREAYGNGYNSQYQSSQPRSGEAGYLNNSIYQDSQTQAFNGNNSNQPPIDADLPTYNQIYSTPQASNQASSSSSQYPAPIRAEPAPQQKAYYQPQSQSNSPAQIYNPSQNSQQQPAYVSKSTITSAKGTPVNIICPNCKKNVVTSIKRKAGGKTVAAVLGVGLVFWPLMWVPLTMKSLKKKVHVCPYCGIDLGDEILIQVNKLEPAK